MAQIDFFADNFGVRNLNGSGLGFYGNGFGKSVNVGEWQQSTFITDGNGTAEGPQVNNIQWTHGNSGEINGAGSSVVLTAVPNYLATLHIQFTHGSAVRTQNAEARIFDRTDITAGASGVTTKAAELIHPDAVQNNNGSGDTAWLTPVGTSVVIGLADAPGESGEYAGGGTVSTRDDTIHDWYIALSASPDSIGAKTLYGLYAELEYL